MSNIVYDLEELKKLGYTVKDCKPITIKDTIYYVLKEKPIDKQLKSRSTYFGHNP